jgi:AraC-like DNA-binding protein
MGASAESDRVPLARFEVLRSSDFDEVLDRVSNALIDHRMELRQPGGALDARLNWVELGDCALGYVEQGADVAIDTGRVEDCYILYLDLGGETDTEVLGDAFNVTAETAALYSPSCSARLRMGAHAKHLHLRIDRTALERRLEALTGVPVRGPVVFAPRLPLTTGGGAVVKDLVGLLLRHLEQGDFLLRSPATLANLEEALLNTLLTSWSHSHAAGLERNPRALVPRQVKLVEDYIHENAAKPISMNDLVAVAEISARSLYAAFKDYRGCSPRALLRSVRLDRAREKLRAAGPGQSVTEIALDCGFGHLGRFSADYRQRFGELPSQTLRGRRLVHAP